MSWVFAHIHVYKCVLLYSYNAFNRVVFNTAALFTLVLIRETVIVNKTLRTLTGKVIVAIQTSPSIVTGH